MSLYQSNNHDLLEFKHVHVRFRQQTVLRDISVRVRRGETLVVIGESGCGKTVMLKNMIGLAPPAHYRQGGPWKKASFHQGIQEAVFDLNRYRTPDFTLLDATIGMQKAHLWGPTCNPPPNRLAVSYDPVAIDSYGCRLLKIKWDTIGHIAMAHDTLGAAEPLMVSEV